MDIGVQETMKGPNALLKSRDSNRFDVDGFRFSICFAKTAHGTY